MGIGMRETKTAVIDGHKYECGQLPGTKSWKLLFKIAKVVAPSVGGVIDKNGVEGLMDQEVGPGFLATAIDGICQRLDESEVELVIDQLKQLTVVYPNGNGNGAQLSSVFDAHFAGDPFGVVKWLKFALTAQFKDFSGSLANAIGQVQEQQRVAG
jgi:hypothetical protein